MEACKIIKEIIKASCPDTNLHCCTVLILNVKFVVGLLDNFFDSPPQLPHRNPPKMFFWTRMKVTVGPKPSQLWKWVPFQLEDALKQRSHAPSFGSIASSHFPRRLSYSSLYPEIVVMKRATILKCNCYFHVTYSHYTTLRRLQSNRISHSRYVSHNAKAYPVFGVRSDLE